MKRYDTLIQETRTNGEAIKFLAERIQRLEKGSPPIKDIKDKIDKLEEDNG